MHRQTETQTRLICGFNNGCTWKLLNHRALQAMAVRVRVPALRTQRGGGRRGASPSVCLCMIGACARAEAHACACVYVYEWAPGRTCAPAKVAMH